MTNNQLMYETTTTTEFRKPPMEDMDTPERQSSGTDNDYWLVGISDPKRLDPYDVECEDIIEALNMTFQEGEAFKAIWRKAGQRLGNGKPGNTALRDAEKVAHFGQRMVAIEKRNEN